MTARIFRNPGAGPVGDLPGRAALGFHRALPEYSPTPLVDAGALARRLGVARAWVKVESARLGLPSFKILGASWGTYRALDERAEGLGEWSSLSDLRDRLAPHLPLALAAATDGNHGRAVARMARLLGLDARIFVPAGTAAARIAGIEAEGATCTIVDGTYEDAVARAATEADDRCLVVSDTSWEGYERVPRWVIEGYSTIFFEIDDALGSRRPDVVVVQMGVGALGASAARHFRHAGTAAPPVLIGVEPARAACVLASAEAGRLVTVPGPHDSIMAGLNCGTPSAVAWPYVIAGYDAFVAVDDNRAEQAMRLLAAEGIEAGETGAAGLAGLIELVEGRLADYARDLGIGPDAKVLLLCTEGATDPQAYARIVR